MIQRLMCVKYFFLTIGAFTGTNNYWFCVSCPLQTVENVVSLETPGLYQDFRKAFNV